MIPEVGQQNWHLILKFNKRKLKISWPKNFSIKLKRMCEISCWCLVDGWGMTRTQTLAIRKLFSLDSRHLFNSFTMRFDFDCFLWMYQVTIHSTRTSRVECDDMLATGVQVSGISMAEENVILMMWKIWRREMRKEKMLNQAVNISHDAITPFNWHSLHSHFSFLNLGRFTVMPSIWHCHRWILNKFFTVDGITVRFTLSLRHTHIHRIRHPDPNITKSGRTWS